MSNATEIEVDPVKEPLFEFVKELEGGTRLFKYDHRPFTGILSINPMLIVIPFLTFKSFNPGKSEKDAELVRVGDLIEVSCDPTTEIFKKWGPPEDYLPPENFTAMFRVRMAERDTTQSVLVVADESI